MNKTATFLGSLILLIIAVVGGYFVFKNATKAIPPVAIITASPTPDSVATTSVTSVTSTTTTTATPTVTKPHAFGAITLRLGEAVTYTSGTLTIKELLEDSRCPQNVYCIQAGTVRVNAYFLGPAGSNSVVLTLGKKTMIGGIEITLESVTPGRTVETNPLNTEYRFTIIVAKISANSEKKMLRGGLLKRGMQ